MKIFITGGTGFIGRHLIEGLLGTEHNLALLVRNNKSNNNNNIKYITGNLSRIQEFETELKDFSPDAAIHLGWEGIPDYSYNQSIKNLNYGLNVYRFLAKAGCRKIITAGSCWEYGCQQGCLSESDAVKPYDAFSSAKNSLHWLGKELAAENNISFIWLRLFYVYGKGQRGNSLIPYIIRCINNNLVPEIRNPYNKHDFIHVKDVANSIIMSLDYEENYGLFNVGAGYSKSVHDIIKLIYNILDKKNLFEIKEQNQSEANFWADITEIKNKLNWMPQTDIINGIKNMLLNNKNE